MPVAASFDFIMAESESEPCKKKIKICPSFSPQALRKHKRHISAGLGRLQKFHFCFVKLFNCNGSVSTCFSNAFCESVRNIECRSEEDGQPKVAKFDELFDTGLLRRVLDGPVDLGTSQKIAFQRLDLFLENIEGVSRLLLENIFEDTSEAELAGLIGTHVLKPLAVDQHMIVSDSGYSGRKGHCCCKSSSCKEVLNYGDTSLGHPRVWHGSVDIMLGSSAVAFIDDRDQADPSTINEPYGTSSFEQCREQLIAETIVYGFVKRCGLVPLVAISKGQVKIYLYSPDHDLFYEGMECDLFKDIMGQGSNKTLSHSVVILLWFALNYQIFLKGVDPSHLENAYTLDFKSMIQERAGVLNIYENEMRFGGCKHAPSKKPFLFYDY